MQCRNCSAEIAEKAIVCYRCGTPTADLAEVPRHAPPPARGRFALIIVLVVIALAAALYVFFSGRAGDVQTPDGQRGAVISDGLAVRIASPGEEASI